MQLLLRKVTQDADGQNEYLDISLEGEELTIGSSPQCDIQLLGMHVAARHARLEQEGEKIQLVTEKNARFVMAGKNLDEAALQAGDEFAIDAQRFKCVTAPAGFDLALEWYFEPVPGHLLENAYRTSLEQLGFSLRKTSWWLVLAIVLIGGLTPVADNYWRRLAISVEPENVVTENNGTIEIDATEIAEQPSTPAPTLTIAALGRPAADHIWLSGPMLPAHQIAIGDRCEVCHQQPFQRVRDNACLDCHSQIENHLNFMHPAAGGFREFRCQHCHKEHNEQQEIVASSDRLCVQCHGDNEVETQVLEFSSNGHPQFAATLLVPDLPAEQRLATTNWRTLKVEVNTDIKEQNHLIFPHDVHLNAKAVTHLQRGDGLLCADCHQLNSDGEHFAPIVMEQHCADCHDLSFDLDNPQKQLPHGEPKEVFEVLKNHFIELAFNPRESTFTRRRLPGKVAIDERCVEDYNCARQQAQQQAEKQFLQSGCITCHQVNVVDNTEAGEQWQVLPVKLNPDWYSSSRFDHGSHLTPTSISKANHFNNESGTNNESGAKADGYGPGRGNNAVCQSCHRADLSTASEDVLMPTRSQCTNCHGDGADGGFLLKPRVALNCIACHDYHSANQFHARGPNDATP